MMVCTACGAGWWPGHRCAGMVGIEPTLRESSERTNIPRVDETRRYLVQRVYGGLKSEPIQAPFPALRTTIWWTASELNKYLNSYAGTGVSFWVETRK